MSFVENEKGYIEPQVRQDQISLLSKICPAGGNALSKCQDGSIWGHYKSASLGWSQSEVLRKGASSGGVLSTICLYLLDHGLVNGIIQTRRSKEDIRKTETIVSRTNDDVLSCLGSRYTTSSPLMKLDELLKENEVYAFVGKPCDVSVIRLYMEEVNPEMKHRIKYLFSFFCAGQPSIDANNRLIKALGGTDLSECSDLQYRGNGWPGFATLTMKDGTHKQMDYETSWMSILGRDVRKICRFCADGTGELADISCGDAWYLDDNGKPDFTERPGRNVIFARTEKGEELLRHIINNGKIEAVAFNPDSDGLKKMQPYHYTRKASLQVYKWALSLCGRPFPNYDRKKTAMFAKAFPLKQKILRFGGTVQRVLKGTI